MKSIQWHYPESVSEALEILWYENAAFHGGGTAILRAGAQRYSHLIDLSKTGLNTFKAGKDFLEIGASLTYCDVLMNLKKKFSGHILFRALYNASSTPMRNRITIGGSIAANHIWSDLTGPLLVTDAELKLEGSLNGWFKAEEYLKNRDFKKGTLITALKVPADAVICRYHRETRTKVDYPMFTLSVLCSKKHTDYRVAVTGHNRRFERLTQLENILNDTKGKVPEDGFPDSIALTFSSNKSYCNDVWQVYLMRMIEDISRRHRTGRSK